MLERSHMLEDKDDERGLTGFDTLPPPPGEDDAYSAATKVRSLPAALAELMRDDEDRDRGVGRIGAEGAEMGGAGVDLPKPPRLPGPVPELPQEAKADSTDIAGPPAFQPPLARPNAIQPEAREQGSARPAATASRSVLVALSAVLVLLSALYVALC